MTEAGFARADITPPTPVVLAGFGGRKPPADHVRHPLEVRALVLRDGDVTLCLLVLDLLMLGEDFAAPIRRAVARALGVPVSRVLTSCTHTHAGPAAGRLARRLRWPPPDGYGEHLARACTAAASAARDGLAPVGFAFARGALPPDVSVNRRGLPYEPSLALLGVRAPDGALAGLVVNVAVHPVALGPACGGVSGDWVSVCRATLEREFGVPVVVLSGALGDVNPGKDPHADPPPGGDWEAAEGTGRDVAAAARDLVAALTPAGTGVAVLRERALRSRVGLTLVTALTGTALRRTHVELVEWLLGEVRLVSLPGEAFHALGREVERARGGAVLLAGIAPVWQGYLPVPFRRGYEERMSFGRGFVTRVRRALLDVPALPPPPT